MDWQTIWQQSPGEDDELHRLLHQTKPEKLESKLPLKKLRQALAGGIAFGAVITAFYGVLFFNTPLWQVRVALFIVSLFNLWIMWKSWLLYRHTPPAISPNNSLRQELQKNYDSFQQWWRLQEKVSLFIYPVAVAGGFILGGQIGSGKPVEAFLYNTKVLIALGLCMVILVPACYYLAKWMFNYAYGRHLKKLRQLIAELED